MFPQRERLREIAEGPEGSLREVPYAVLLAALALEKRDGVVVLSRRQAEKRIVFRGGVPLECSSNMLHETFGRYLVGQGKITEETFAVAFARANATGLRLGEVLVEQGVLAREDVARLLQANLARKLLDGFTWTEGDYRILDERPEVDELSRVNVAQLIVTGVSRFATQAAVDAAVGTLVGRKLALAPEPPFSIEEIRLSEDQARLATALEKRARIDELATAAPGLSFEEITRLIYALWLLGTVVTADPAARSAPPPAVPVPSPPPAPPAPPVAPVAAAPAPRPAAVPESPSGAGVTVSAERALDARREELRRTYESQHNLDAYELFGLADDADEASIRNRYLEKAEAWAPWQFGEKSSDVSRATALFLAAARAYAELADPRSRETLQRNRRVTGQAVKASAPTRPADVLDPEGQHRKGMELLDAGKAKLALPVLELAAELDPQNGSWAADTAWCRYQAGTETANVTISSLDEAIRIDSRAGVACLYAGHVLRDRGDAVRAEAYYRKAAKLMSPDRRPLDALRELVRGVRT